VVESGAGKGAGISDEDYHAAGGGIASADARAGAQIVLGVQGPDPALLANAAPGAWVVASLDPLASAAGWMPMQRPGWKRWPWNSCRASPARNRWTSFLAGQPCRLQGGAGGGQPLWPGLSDDDDGGRHGERGQGLRDGVGVAGLQAIATARRLGAQVSATDVRSATKEQIQSLGAKPIFVENVAGIEGEGAGGYATEMSPEYQKAQAELVSSHIAKQDIVITTALIPGRAAPRLITDAQIATMRPGSVIYDLAVAQGGNVEGSLPDQVVERHGVKIVGYANTPALLPADASALFSRNLFNFLSAFWDKEQGRPVLDEEIGHAIRLTQGGRSCTKG
jgi:NAD(P) transhydrogenase subunit alpha